MPEPIAFDQDILTTNTGAVQTVGGSDILMSAIFSAHGYPTYARRIRAGGAGTIGIKRAGDSAFVPYPVNQGDYIDGRIVAVGSTSDGSSVGMTFIPEQ